MKIVKEGNLEFARGNYGIEKILRFNCDSCGCVFDATDRECEDFSTILLNKPIYAIKCPTCGNSVSVQD